MRSEKRRPVKIITDNSVETVVFGNTDIAHPCTLKKMAQDRKWINDPRPKATGEGEEEKKNMSKHEFYKIIILQSYQQK